MQQTFILGNGCVANLATLIDTRLLIQSNSGGGKSFAVRRLLEQTHGKVQQLILDPEGEFSSLREKFDYVLAAKGGDTPADPRTAALLTERLLELQVSAILDIYELKHHSRIEFVKTVLETLVNAPKALWHPVLVVIDESHIFCPQKGEAESLGAVIDLCSRGRKRGFCAVLATQRLSKLHKDAAAECNNKLIGRSSLDVDMKRAAEELGFSTREQQIALRQLEPGEFYAYGPALTREVTKTKIGAIQTTHPKAGARIAFTAPAPTAKVKAILSKLADLPAEQEQRARTMADLTMEVARLRREVAAKPTAPPAPAPKRVDVPVLKDGQITRLERLYERFRGLSLVITEEMGKVQGAIKRINPVIDVTRPAQPKDVEPQGQWSEAERRQRSLGPTPRPTIVFPLPPGERKVLQAVAAHQEGIDRKQLSVLVGYRKSTRNIYVGRLATKGFVDASNHRIRVTEAGAALLGPDFQAIPPSGQALQDFWMAKLPKGEAALLGGLLRRYPAFVSRDDISEATGLAKSSRNLYIGRLASRQLVTIDRDGVRASETLI
jgi:hypothetical protein